MPAPALVLYAALVGLLRVMVAHAATGAMTQVVETMRVPQGGFHGQHRLYLGRSMSGSLVMRRSE